MSELTPPERETYKRQLEELGWTCKSCRHNRLTYCDMGHEFPQKAARCYSDYGNRGFERESGSDEEEDIERTD